MEEVPPIESTNIKVEEPRLSSGNVKVIGISPYHHYTGFRGVALE